MCKFLSYIRLGGQVVVNVRSGSNNAFLKTMTFNSNGTYTVPFLPNSTSVIIQVLSQYWRRLKHWSNCLRQYGATF